MQLVIQNAQQLINLGSHRLSNEDLNSLRENSQHLRSRYDLLSRHSAERLSRLEFCQQDLTKEEGDLKDFEDWLRPAEEEMDRILRNVGTDVKTLSAQARDHQNFKNDVVTHSADLKYLNKSVTQYLEAAQVKDREDRLL